MDVTELSKLLSRILRHRPDAAGVRLDKQGWCEVDDLLVGLARAGTPVTREQLEEVVRHNDKLRFVIDGHRIRAAQGHSVTGIKPVLREKKPPSQLFHGTPLLNAASIERKGLLPMRRHHVHLSVDESTATSVGSRRSASVVVFVVDSGRMSSDGQKFYLSTNEVWLTDVVAPKYLSRSS